MINNSKKDKIKKEVSAPVGFLETKTKVFFLFFFFAMVLFGNSISNNYSLDDELVTYNHSQVQKGIRAIPEIFTTRYVSESERSNYGYRPIVKVSFAIEHQFFGENPHIGHFLNILLYTLVCTVLYLFLRRIFNQRPAAFSFWITMLFLFHPIHNEVVVSLKNRDALFSLLFGLLSISAFIDALEKGTWKYIQAIIFLVLAFLSKTDVLPFLFLIPFTLFYFKGVGLKRALGFIAAVVAVFIVGKLLIGSALSDDASRRLFIYIENPLFFTPGLEFRIIAGFNSFFFYLQKLFIPYPLISYYGYNTIEVLNWDLKTILSGVIAGALIWYIIRNFKKASEEKDPLYYGVVFFCVSVSMFLNIVKPAVGIVAERFLFVPSVGFSIAAVVGIYKLFKTDLSEKKIFGPSNMVVCVSILLIVFSGISIARNKDWKDHLTLYQEDANKAEASAKLHALAGAKLIQNVMNGNVQDPQVKSQYVKDAIQHYHTSLAIYPDYVSSLNNLGMIYQSFLKKPAEARPYLEKAIKLDSTYIEAYYNLGLTWLKEDSTKAEHYMLEAIRHKKDFVLSYNSLTKIYLTEKKFAEAESLNTSALALFPDIADLNINLGKVALAKQDTVTGVKYLDRGYMLNPKNEMLGNFLIKYYTSKGKSLEAQRIHSAR